MIRRYLFRLLKLLFYFALVTIVVAPEWPAFGDKAYQLNTLVGQRQFDFFVWEMNAIRAKATAILANGHSYLDEPTRQAIVLEYLESITEIGRLERQLELAFADPETASPNERTLELQADLAPKRQALQALQPVAEAIAQDQVADILTIVDFELLGQAWPPVMMHMTPLPSILIISPRDRIERQYGIPLIHGLSTPDKEELEASVLDQLDFSGLVVPIGGLGIYPAMILETNSINRLAEVIAHEWAHHWLSPYPISLSYGTNAQVRTMNETVASIVGTEIGRMVIEQYYPEFVPPPAQPAAESVTDLELETPPAFDFRAEMALTRIEAEALLAKGLIEEAESYMEERRQFLWENGYQIRKLNQAYFAFYGAYADEPGATGGDPIGPILLEIRSRSNSLKAFMQAVAPVNSFDELEAVLEDLKQ